MFTAETRDVRIFQKVFNGLQDFAEDAHWYCSKEGMHLQCVDRSNVALCSFYVPANSFDHYSCIRKVVLRFRVTNMTQILRCARRSDVLLLTCNDNDDRIKFVFESPKGERCAEFEMTLLDPQEDYLDVSKISHDAHFCLPSKEFDRICQNLDRLGDVVDISNDGEHVQFQTSGNNDLEHAITVYRQSCTGDDRQKPTQLSCARMMSLQLSVRYLRLSAEMTCLTSRVVLEMNEDSPLVVKYNLENFGQLTFYLGQRKDLATNNFRRHRNVLKPPGVTSVPAGLRKCFLLSSH